MASVGLVLTTLDPSPAPSPAQSGATAGPQANADPLQGGSQNQDTVTLAGRTADSQQTGTGNGNAQFAETAAFFYAEQQSFRAANGSVSTPAQAKSVPDMPVKIGNEGANETQNAQDGTPAAVASAASQSPNATGDVNAGNGAGGSASATSGSAQTPIAELAQLDDTLQQMGINPQSITLFNRMAMLLYANDPAALRVLVQTLQTGTQQLAGSSNGAEAGGSTSTGQSAAASSVQGLLPSQTQSSSTATIQTQGGSDNARSAALVDQTSADGAAIVSVNANTSLLKQEAPQAPQPKNSFSAQLEGLQITFAAVGGDVIPSGEQNSSSGLMLNVTA